MGAPTWETGAPRAPSRSLRASQRRRSRRNHVERIVARANGKIRITRIISIGKGDGILFIDSQHSRVGARPQAWGAMTRRTYFSAREVEPACRRLTGGAGGRHHGAAAGAQCGAAPRYTASRITARGHCGDHPSARPTSRSISALMVARYPCWSARQHARRARSRGTPARRRPTSTTRSPRFLRSREVPFSCSRERGQARNGASFDWVFYRKYWRISPLGRARAGLRVAQNAWRG